MKRDTWVSLANRYFGLHLLALPDTGNVILVKTLIFV